MILIALTATFALGIIGGSLITQVSQLHEARRKGFAKIGHRVFVPADEFTVPVRMGGGVR